MAGDPAIDIQTYLDSTIASLTAGTNLFTGSPSETGSGADAVFVVPLSGPPPEGRSMGETNELRVALVNIFIRNQGWKTGRDLAKEIHDSFNGLDAGPSGYEHIDTRQSFPGDIGRDDSGRWWFSTTVRLRWNEDLT